MGRRARIRVACAIAMVAASVLPAGAFGAVAWHPGEFVYRSPAEFGGVYDVEVGDVTGDGRNDLVAADPAANVLVVLPATGGGNFGPAVTTSLGPTPDFKPLDLDLGNINGDSAADAVVFTLGVVGSGYEGHMLTVFGSNTGAFTGAVEFSPPRIGTPAFLNADGDSNLDVVVLDSFEAAIGTGNGTGGFSFAPARRFPLDFTVDGSPAPQGMSLATGNLNGGVDDVVFGTGAGSTAGRTVALLGGPGGSYTMSVLPNLGTGYHRGVALGSVLGSDSIGDVLTTQVSGTTTGRVDAFAGDGAGAFAALPTVRIDGDAYGITVADFDVDGDQDAMTVNYGIRSDFPFTGRFPSSVNWLRNTPAGLVTLPIVAQQEFVSPGYALDGGEVNGDGVPDLAAATYNGLVLYRSYDDGNPPETSLAPAPGSGSAASASTRGNRNPPVIGSRRPTFRFSANEDGAAFTCQVDRRPRTECRSPFKLRRLNNGVHTFKVRANDLAQNLDPTAARRTFVVRPHR